MLPAVDQEGKPAPCREPDGYTADLFDISRLEEKKNRQVFCVGAA
jgi:hypothetical protein